MAVSTFKPGAGVAGGNDSGGTVIAAASNSDSTSSFTLAGDFTSSMHVIQIQGEANATITILALDASTAVLENKTVTADAGGASSVTMVFPSGTVKLGISGLAGYITVLKFETATTSATIGPDGYREFSLGQADPLQFLKIGFGGNVVKGNLHVKENAHSWFIPDGGNSAAQYWIISKKTGAADFPIVINSATDYQSAVLASHAGFAVTDDYIMMGQNTVNATGASSTRDVFKFVYNEVTDQYVCDMDDTTQWIADALPAGHTTSSTLQSFEYAPNIGANGTLFTNSYGDTSVYYSQDHGATWSIMGGLVSSNGANLRYYRDTVSGNDHLLYNGFPYTNDLYYCDDFTDLANATWTSWSWPSSSTDYLNIDYNEQGQFWTTTFETDNNTIWTTTTLGGSWTARNFSPNFYGNPSPALSVNGTTVVFSRSQTSGTTTSGMIRYSTDGVTWDVIIADSANRNYFQHNASYTNYVNAILYASGTKIRGLSDRGGFQFDTATSQPMLPFSPIRDHNLYNVTTDPTGQYVLGWRQGESAIVLSADYGNSWSYFNASNPRWGHWFNGKFWIGEFNNTSDIIAEYDEGSGAWIGSVRNFAYTYAMGMTVTSANTAFTYDYTTSGLTMYTLDGGENWSNGNDCLVPVASKDSKVAYGVYSGNMASFTSSAQLDAYVLDINGSTVNSAGGANNDFYISGIPYKDGAVLVGKNYSNPYLVNFLYIVNGVAQHGQTNGWIEVNLNTLAGNNYNSWDADDKPALWAFAGKLYCQIAGYGYLYGATNFTLVSQDDGLSWSLADIDTPLRNAGLFPKHQSSVTGGAHDWSNHLGNADYDVQDRGYFYAALHNNSSAQFVTNDNNITTMRITSGVKEL